MGSKFVSGDVNIGFFIILMPVPEGSPDISP